MPFEPFVQSMGIFGKDPFGELDPCGAQTREPAAVHDRIRVPGGDHDAGHPRRDHRLAAWRCRAVMVAGFEGAVKRRSACSVTGFPKRMNLCVRATARTFVPSLADDLVALDHEGADHRVGRHQTATTRGELESPAHAFGVFFGVLLAVSLHVRPLDRGEVGTRGARFRANARNLPRLLPSRLYGRSRNLTGSTLAWLAKGRGLSPPVGNHTPPWKRVAEIEYTSVARQFASQKPREGAVAVRACGGRSRTRSPRHAWRTASSPWPRRPPRRSGRKRAGRWSRCRPRSRREGRLASRLCGPPSG